MPDPPGSRVQGVIVIFFFLLHSRVQLNRRFESSSDLNLLDKLMDSLRSRITPSGNCEREDFLTRIKETISENIKPCQPCQPIETATVTDYPEDHLGAE